MISNETKGTIVLIFMGMLITIGLIGPVIHKIYILYPLCKDICLAVYNLITTLCKATASNTGSSSPNGIPNCSTWAKKPHRLKATSHNTILSVQKAKIVNNHSVSTTLKKNKVAKQPAKAILSFQESEQKWQQNQGYYPIIQAKKASLISKQKLFRSALLMHELMKRKCFIT
ncbi:hypothetical protein ACRRVB_03800 [Candidatus Cardinium hertigii]|uniref:hypothetical protein n=1 Tax=Candidatus Cardinium hertigii TaxID=247481 RepID=UPI003D7DFC87